MKKILKLLSIFIIFCTILANLNIVAAVETESLPDELTENIKDEEKEIEENVLAENGGVLLEESEDSRSEDVIYRMDEDGNIFEATDLDLPGRVDDEKALVNPHSRQQQVAVVNFNKGRNEITNYTEAGTGRAGYTHGQFGADGAYLEHSADGRQVKFMLSDVVGWVNASEVEVVRYDSANVRTLSYYTVNSNDRIIHNISTNINSTTHGTALTVGLASSAPYLRTGVIYYSYDGHYFYDNSDGNGYSRMLADYRNGVRTNSVNPNNPYYNYFQYLPHRSTTNYSAAELDEYFRRRHPNDTTSKMLRTGSSFVSSQNAHSINALLMYGVAINESNWGRSNIAQTRNNLFGHAAYDSNPGSATGYATVADSIEHHANGFLSRGYLNPSDWRYGGSHVGSKGSGVNIQYASDPYWGVKAAAQAWVLDLTMGQKDAYKYTLGIKDTINTSHTLATVRNAANTTATGLYTTAPGATTRAISNYPFIVLDQAAQNGFYRIQSNTPLNASRTATNPTGTFNFTRDHVFIPTSNTIITGGIIDTEPPVVSNVVVSNVTSSGYTVTATVTDNVGVTRVLFPTWTTHNGQDDLIWYEGTISDNTASVTIKTSRHNNRSGEYNTHIYAYDAAGNVGTASIEPIQVPATGIRYLSYIQNEGWESGVVNGETSGTISRSLRLEATRIHLTNQEHSGSIQYQAHVQDIGWQPIDGTGHIAGVPNGNKRMEAIRIELTGEIANHFDVYYRVHVQDMNWLGWAKNGESAGTTGYGRRIEAMQVVLVKKGESAPGSTNNAFSECQIRYQMHVQDIGWQDYSFDGETAGTVSQHKRAEAIRIELMYQKFAGSIQYRAHVQDIGWQGWQANGGIAGTSNRSLRLEAIEIKLTDEMAANYDVYYRLQVQEFGWLGWAKNGESAGTRGFSYRAEAIEIQLVPKGERGPQSNVAAFRSRT